MNINDLTIGQAKELTAMFGAVAAKESPLLKSMIGKYVIVRSRNEGINAGTVINADDTGIILGDARRIWYHKPKDTAMAWYEGVSVSGLSSDSKAAVPVAEKVIMEDYSITVCTDTAKASIQEHKVHGQN